MKSGRTIWKQMIVALAAVVLAGVMAVALPEPAFAAKKDIASGGDENITWVIDANGKMTVKGTGDVGRTEDGYPEWYEYRYDITSAVINVTGMTDASYLFFGCSNITELNVSGFDTSSVTSMEYMFFNCLNLNDLDISGFDTSNVTSMKDMFYECENLKKLDVSKFDTSNVVDMSGMFSFCYHLTNIDVSGFDTSNVTDMGEMFYFCTFLTNLDVSGFNTSNVTSMKSMFSCCGILAKLDVSGFDTSSVTDMSEMFWCCGSLENLNVSGFDASKVTSMSDMFSGCSNLNTIYSPKNVVCDDANLPTTDDYAWCLPNGTVVTEVPKNSSKSVKLTRKPQYTENNTTIKLSETSYTYTGKALKPTVSVKDSNGKKISSKYYTVTYKNNKKVGKATLTIKFRNGYVGTIKKTFTINPKATKLRTATSAKTKTIAVKWKKQATQTTGYEIQYATDKKFTKNKKTITVKSAKTTSTSIKNLSAKKMYYVRIRAYKTVDGKKYYSDWSKVQSVKTK